MLVNVDRLCSHTRLVHAFIEFVLEIAYFRKGVFLNLFGIGEDNDLICQFRGGPSLLQDVGICKIDDLCILRGGGEHSYEGEEYKSDFHVGLLLICLF